MATDLQLRKFEKLFENLDTDGDGVIDQADVDRLVQGWCAAFGVPPGSERWRQATARSNKLWQSLESRADADGDTVVGKQEWVAAHEDPAFIENVAIPLAEANFDLADVDQDGRVALNEWMTAQSVVGLGQIEALEAFQLLDADGDGFITAEEHLAALHEFYRSTDSEDAGNLMAGRL
jgi:Ca2+-binding EF-hand superfamily protein